MQESASGEALRSGGGKIRTASRRSRRADRPAPPPGGRGPLSRSLLLALAAFALGMVLAAVFVLPRGPSAPGVAIATLHTGDFHALAFSPAEPDVIFFGHHNGIFRSADGGRTWEPLVDRQGFDAMGLGISRADPARIYLAGHDILQVSADGGRTWRPVEHTLPGTDLHAFALSPDDPNRLYTFAVGHGVFRSTDGGHAWQPLEGLPGDVTGLASAGGDPDTLFVASARAGVLRSTDGGRTWTQPGASVRGTVLALALASDAQIVYAGTDGGLSKSTDGGTTWTELPYPGSNAVALAVSPTDPQVIVAIGVAQNRTGLVYRSEDGGATWAARS